MRKIISIVLFFFICTFSYARDWCFSALGDDNTGNGTQASPFKTIAKLNTIWASINAGDRILFNGGDTFLGSIVVGKSGTVGNIITIGSYGTGQAIISGLQTVSGWTVFSGNIWRSSVTASKNSVNILTIDGTPVDLGRTPNCNAASPLWSVYQSATTSNIVSSTFSTPVPIGAEIVIKKNSFTAARSKITSQVGNTVNYIPVKGIDNNNPLDPTTGKPLFGCFIQRYPGSLDVQNEWYFDTVTKRYQLYSNTNPSGFTIKGSVLDTGIVMASRSYITIDNLKIEGFGFYAVEAFTCANITVKNCTFENNTRAVYSWSSDDMLVDNNVMSNCLNNAILFGQNSNNPNRRITITNNTVLNTGKLWGVGTFPTNFNYKAVVALSDTTRANNYILVDHNKVLYTGYMGIEFQGSNVTVSKNFVNRFDSTLDDGGAIYNFGSITPTNLTYNNRVIDSNICLNAIGSWQGTDRATTQLADVASIYLDEQAGQMNIYGNTIGNVPVTPIGNQSGGNGVQMNAPVAVTLRDNTIYNADYAIQLNKKAVRAISGVTIHKNIIYQKTNQQYNFFHINTNLKLPTPMTILQSLRTMGDIDSNWISQLKPTGFGFYYSSDGVNYTFPAPANLANWRGDSILHDIHSILPPSVLNNTNTTLYVNPSDTALRINWNGFQKVDPKGVTYNNFAVLAPWGSMIAIDNGTATPINKYPVVTATAGNDSVLTLPANTAHLTGSATDTDGVITSYRWVQLSGPSTVSGLPFTTTTTPNFTATNLVEGIYQFQLSATDNGGATTSTIIRVTVNAAIPNTPPTANAGVDKTITLPTTSTSITGSGTNGSGTLISYSWTQISGPATVTFGTGNAQTTTINNLTVDGTYTIKLTVTNNLGDIASDYMQVFVNPAPIVLPTANAGSDKAITLPTTSTSATASATLGSGTLTSYTWSFVTGPTTATFGSANALTTTINNLTIVGTYTVKFTVLNSQGNSASDNLDIVVSPAIPPVNQPPVSVPGSNQTITLPTNTATVNGSGSTDPDGTITAYQWTITGPNTATSTTPNAVSTTFGNLIVGTYQARLRVTDNNSDTGSASLTITVLAAPNVLPTAVAGNDQTITLPTNSTTVDGSGSSDPDGITAYGWVQISGPSAATIASPSTAITGISNMGAGDYVFQLKVTGSNGSSDTAVDAIQITVEPAPVINPPIAYAGADSTVQLPQTTVHLLGGGVNGTGTINGHTWAIYAKPVGAPDPTFDNAGLYNVLVSGLQEGVYIFQITVTDDNGLTATDLVQVTVRPIPDQTIRVLLGYLPIAN